MSVPLSPIALVANEDTDFRRPVKVIDVDKADIAEQVIGFKINDAVIVFLRKFFEKLSFPFDRNN